MPIIDYPFFEINGKPKPALCVKLINPENKIECKTWALIDTGADCTVIPKWIANDLDHILKHKDVKKDYCSGIGGGAISYQHTFGLEIFKSDKKGNLLKKPVITIKPRLYPVVEDCGIMILGMDDFLKNYTLIVNYPKQLFSLRLP